MPVHDIVPTESVRGSDSRVIEPHRRLMAAVLQTVLDDCRGSVYRRSRNYPKPMSSRGVRNANAYVASTDRTWPFSFENLCEALGLNAGGLRRELQSIPEAIAFATCAAGDGLAD